MEGDFYSNARREVRHVLTHMTSTEDPLNDFLVQDISDQDMERLVTETVEAVLNAFMLRPRYYLLGHPAWPDGLPVWPSTQENAFKVFEDNPHPRAKLVVRWEPQAWGSLLPKDG